MDNVIVVVPTIREDRIKTFLDAWRFECPVIVVEDNPEPSFKLPRGVIHYAWCDIDADLGTDSWIIPRRTDCVRSYGYYKAYQSGADYIVTLDDDCLPHQGQSGADFLAAHIANLQPQAQLRWHSTLLFDRPRGHPYESYTSLAPVGISHGLWRGVADFDAPTQLVRTRAGTGEPRHLECLIPRGSYYPMCGMNLAWRRSLTPLLYFGLQGMAADGTPWPYDRFGDIWAGVIAKKILDHLGIGVWSGGPFVQHERASNVWANLRKETPGLPVNEDFWQWIDATKISGNDPSALYDQIADALGMRGGYWATLRRAMLTWGGLFYA